MLPIICSCCMNNMKYLPTTYNNLKLEGDFVFFLKKKESSCEF